MRTIGLLVAGLTLIGSAAQATDLEAKHREIMERVDRIEANPDGASESERLQEFIDLYFEYVMLESPELATMLGLGEGHDRWSDNSLAAITRREQDQARALEIC